jgi:hypothetical protein
MGGPGSGWFRARRQTVRKVERLDVQRYRRDFDADKPRTFALSWPAGASMGAQVDAEGLELHYQYRHNGEDWRPVVCRLALTWTPCNYGGRRPWWTCPACGGRCRFVYLAGERFTCRRCARLTYATCQASGNLFEQAQAAGLPGLLTLDARHKGPAAALRRRLERARSPERRRRLELRIERLEALLPAALGDLMDRLEATMANRSHPRP